MPISTENWWSEHSAEQENRVKNVMLWGGSKDDLRVVVNAILFIILFCDWRKTYRPKILLFLFHWPIINLSFACLDCLLLYRIVIVLSESNLCHRRRFTVNLNSKLSRSNKKTFRKMTTHHVSAFGLVIYGVLSCSFCHNNSPYGSPRKDQECLLPPWLAVLVLRLAFLHILQSFPLRNWLSERPSFTSLPFLGSKSSLLNII